MTEAQKIYEVARVEPREVINFEEYAMSSAGVLKQVAVIQEVMKSVMILDEHYGTIPGTKKPSLYKAGAEKLSLTFRLRPEYEIRRSDLGNGHREYEVVATLYHIPTGQSVGQGVGSATTMEGKYRFRKAELVCPDCGKATIIKGKKEFGGGWICYAKKGGCGKKWPDKGNPFDGVDTDRMEHDNPADYYNTVLKMAKKRAHVDAILTATAASDIFTQDVEDMPEVIPGAKKEAKNEEKPTDGQEPTPAPEIPATATAEASAGKSQDFSGLSDTIIVDDVRKKTGGTVAKPWTKYTVVASEAYGKTEYNTFDAKFATKAKEASGAGRRLVISYEVGKYGNDIKGVSFEDEAA